MSDWRPDQFLLVRVDGSTEPIDRGYESIKEGIGGWIDFVTVTKDFGFFIDDDGMLKGNIPLNVPISMLSGRAIYGPAVVTRGIPDDNGDSVAPPKVVVEMVQKMAQWWHNVVLAAGDVGQVPYAYPTPETIPPPIITEIPRDWLQ